MEASFIIAMREGLEAFLVFGIILAFLEKTNLSILKKYAWGGFWAGVVSSVFLGIFFSIVVDSFESEELQYIISLAVLLFAIILLTYMLFWMQQNTDTAQMKQKISLSSNQKLVTFLIVFTAILREGFETVLFTLALIMDEQSESLSIFSGLLFGLFGAWLLVWLLFKSSIKLPLKSFFKYTSYLILFIVSGLVGLFIKGMQAYEYLPTYISPLYDSSAFIANDSFIGKVLGILIGYDATPSLLEFLGWFGYLVILFILIKRKEKHA